MRTFNLKQVRIIRKIHSVPWDMTINEIATRTCMSWATARNELLNLIDLGVCELRERKYKFTPEIYETIKKPKLTFKDLIEDELHIRED